MMSGMLCLNADGMKNIWRKYMEKLLNVENYGDGEVDCPYVMGPVASLRKKRLHQLSRNLKFEKQLVLMVW